MYEMTDICRYYGSSKTGILRCQKMSDGSDCVLCEWKGRGLDSDDPCKFFQEPTCKYILKREKLNRIKTKTRTVRNNLLFSRLVNGLQEIGRELLPFDNEEDKKIIHDLIHQNGHKIDSLPLLPDSRHTEYVRLIQDNEGQGVIVKEKKGMMPFPWNKIDPDPIIVRPKLVCKFYNGRCTHYRIGGKKCSLDGYGHGECDYFREPCNMKDCKKFLEKEKRKEDMIQSGMWAIEERPKIQIKIKGEDPDLIPLLRESGRARLIKGFVLYEPELDKENSFVIPEEIRQKEKTLCIHASESGGGKTGMYAKESCATIICGLSGKALKPYYIPYVGIKSCTTHAYFSVPNVCIEITWKKSENIRIDKWYLEYDAPFCRLHCANLWEGDYNELPNVFSQYRAAAKAAIEKAQCYNCQSPHYILK